MTNPLLHARWDTPFDMPPFDVIRDEDYAPAVEVALAEHRAEIAAIADAQEAPTFANTVEALEAAGRGLDRVLGAFYTVAGADSTPAREALQREFSPKLAAHWAEISANKVLFARVSMLWEQREALDLSPEQARGQNVDKRTDIWAFGCVLFACLTGRSAFEGDSIAVTLGAVLHREPRLVGDIVGTRHLGQGKQGDLPARQGGRLARRHTQDQA